MKKIVTWVEKEGPNGYITFEDKELKIHLHDPKQVTAADDEKKDNKRQRPKSLEASEKKHDKKAQSSKKAPIPLNCK